MTTPTRCCVSVRRLGRVSFSRALALQQSLATQYKVVPPQGKAGEVVVCEHNPVFTFGLRQNDYQTQADELRLLGCEVHKVRRGGLTTFHGPGQLVCYPILNLRELKIGVRDYVKCLERAVIATVAMFGVEGFTSEDTGVWTHHPTQGPSKLCSLGIQVSHGVSYHGLAINCTTDLSWFRHITPCGVEGKGVTSLTDVCQRTITISQVQAQLVQHLARFIGFKLCTPSTV